MIYASGTLRSSIDNERIELGCEVSWGAPCVPRSGRTDGSRRPHPDGADSTLHTDLFIIEIAPIDPARSFFGRLSDFSFHNPDDDFIAALSVRIDVSPRSAFGLPPLTGGFRGRVLSAQGLTSMSSAGFNDGPDPTNARFWPAWT